MEAFGGKIQISEHWNHETNIYPYKLEGYTHRPNYIRERHIKKKKSKKSELFINMIVHTHKKSLK